MAGDFITVEEAARRSGLHPNTITRLARAGVLPGFKAYWRGRRRWLVSRHALNHYADPEHGALVLMPGPKVFIGRQLEGAAR